MSPRRSIVVIVASLLLLAGLAAACGKEAPGAEAPAARPAPAPAETTIIRAQSPVRYAYIANAAEGTVSILDLAREVVVGSVKVGEKLAHGTAASPDGRLGYAALEGANEVAVIDADSRSVVARIPVPYSPGMAQHGLDISPDGKYLWVGARQVGESRDVVLAEMAVINTVTRRVEDVIQTGLGTPSHYAITPDGKELWVASTTVDLLWVVDTQQRQVTAAVPLVPPKAERPQERLQQLASSRIIALNEVAISPDGKRAYAVGPVHDLVFVVDIPSRTVVATVKANRSAHGIVVSRDGKEVWTADWGGTLSVIDAETLRIKQSITLGGRPNHIAFSPDGARAYVTKTGDDPETGELVLVDTAKYQPLGVVRVGAGPHEISLEDALPGPATPLAPVSSADITAPSVGGNKLIAGDREDGGPGDVTFSATPAEAAYLAQKGHPPDHWGFVVKLDTHAGDLSTLDIAKLAVVRDGAGREAQPIAWQGLSEDSHHRSGLLVFSGAQTGGRPPSPGEGGYVELVLRNVAGVKERVLRWE